MAESFSNFLSKRTYSSGNTQIIIPKANGQTQSNVVGTRPVGATSQIHSVYITKEQTGSEVIKDVESAGVYVNIYIDDNGTKYYIGHNVCILPYSSFYIEKTITLLSQQTLNIEYTSLNKNQAAINCVCSCVDITD